MAVHRDLLDVIEDLKTVISSASGLGSTYPTHIYNGLETARSQLSAAYGAYPSTRIYVVLADEPTVSYGLQLVKEV